MSFSSLKYDNNAYKQVLAESVGPLQYQLGTPQQCEECLSTDPSIRLQRAGASTDLKHAMVDVNSELLNITRKLSNDPAKKYVPKEDKSGNLCSETPKYNPRDCGNVKTEYTLLSNPPCNLRGTGINRWEWLCQDPQANVITPYYFGTDTKQLAKDLHRPCVPHPFNDRNVRPTGDVPVPAEDEEMMSADMVPTGPPSVSWANLESIKKY
jgi:hypothetical protein